MRKTRCDREVGFTKDRKPRGHVKENSGGRDGGRDRRRRAKREREN